MIYKKSGDILISGDSKLCSTCCPSSEWCDCGGNKNVRYYEVTFTGVDDDINGTHNFERNLNCYWYKLIEGEYSWAAHLWLKEGPAGVIGLEVQRGMTVLFENLNDDISECQESGTNIPNNVGDGTADFEPVL